MIQLENPLYIIIIVAALIITYHFLTKDHKKLKKLRKEWETGEYISVKEDHKSISSYWANKKVQAGNYDGVDQLTWDDLAMEEVFKKVNYTQSTVGSEYLFNELRDIDPKLEDVHQKEELYTLLANDQALREKVLLILSSLGKRNYTNSSSFFYEMKDRKIKNNYLYVLLALLPIASIVLMFFSIKYGITMFFSTYLINIIVYYREKRKLDNDLFAITYVAAIVNAGKQFASIQDSAFTLRGDYFKEKIKPLKKISFFGKIVSFGGNGGEFDVLFEYFRILFLLDLIAYNQIIKTIAKHRADYREIWVQIGKLDAAIAVAFYRKSLAVYSTPIFIKEEELSFENVAHPLIDNPVTNTSTLGKSTLITGSNASGKSTYIKAVAINAILAQTIHTVLAENWTMKPSYVVTSMAIQDSVLDGDSYFIAEIKSLKRIIRLSEAGKPVLSFVDEILKGTNTIERIAASAAMMEWFAVNQGMNLIASHDIELTEIARHTYVNYHFRESIENGEVQFDYKVHPGPSVTRNAIKLLEILQYPESITRKANEMAMYFTEQREWQEIQKEQVYRRGD